MKRFLCSVLIFCLAFTIVPSAVLADEVVDNSHLITYKQPENWDDYVIDEDPMQIADDEFFGVWDEENQEWTKQPYFRYDEFPDMIKVKEAAMAADYNLAKEELLAYYLTVRDSRYTPVTSNPGRVKKIRAEALEKNVYTVGSTGMIQGFITFDNEWSEQRVNVAEGVMDEQLIGYGTYVGFALMSVDKHLTQAEITARESGTPAYLELVVNGSPVKFEAVKDTVVRGGPYGTVNYGTEPILTVQESGHYQNFNADTKRAYIAFDISSLKPTDNVTSATLVVNGRNASGTGPKEICVYHDADAAYEETELVFDDFTDCLLWSCNDQNTWDFQTSNEASIKGKAATYQRGNELTIIADMYDYSKKERYAYTFIRQQMGYVNNVGFDTRVLNSLDMSVNTKFVTKNIYQVMDSKYMTGERLTAMLKTLWLFANYQVNVFYGTRDNNWGTFATSSVYSLLARFPEFAVFDEWYAITQEENERLTVNFVMPDGMSYEICQGYTTTLLGTLSDPFSVQQETGMPVAFNDEVMDIAYNLVKSLVFCSSPGFRGYGIGDSTGDFDRSFAGTVKEWYYMAFDDEPIFEYVATNGSSGKMPDNPTTRYPISLRTYMRSSWDDDAFAMSFINTDHNKGSHGQFDHLSITLLAYGKYLLGDPGLGSLTGGEKQFNSSAPQHNLVTVNNSDHEKIYNTREKAFESNKIYDFIEYAGTYTQDVDQARNVLYLKNQKFWIVGDYANPQDQTKENSFEQNWHMHPTCNLSIDEETFEIQSNNSDINVSLFPVGTDDLTAYKEETVFMLRGELAEVNYKGVLKKTATGDAVFNTIILPRNVNEDFEVSSNIIETELSPTVVNAFSARIKNTLTGKENYYYYYHLNDIEQKQPVTVAQFKTDATTMLVETDLDGNVTSTFLMGATFLEDSTLKEKVLFKSLEPVAAIAYEKNGQIFNVYSSTLAEEEFDNITMYAPGQYNVRFDGNFMDGKRSGNYLYFGDEPIIVGEETDDAEDVVTKPGKEHSSSGMGGGSSAGGSSAGGSSSGSSSAGGSVVTPPPVVVPPVQPEPEKPEIPDSIEKELDAHWGKEEITSLYNSGVVKGDTTGLRLKDSISRAEFITLVVRALNLDLKEYDNNFADVNENHWYATYIATAFDAGLVNGSDGMFRPDDMITREEMCKIIAQVTDLDYELKENDFTDRYAISDWAMEYVNKVYSLGIIKGMDDGRFEPKSNTLREQAFVILSRVIDIIKFQ